MAIETQVKRDGFLYRDSKIEHQLDIQGHRLVALEYNHHLETVPIVFIHGIANSVYLWEDVPVDYLCQNFRWFSLSLPGHYPALLPPGMKLWDFTPELIGNLLSEAIHQLTGGQKILLIGYSTGGYASLCIAHHAPELIERLLLLDSFARGIFHPEIFLSQMKSYFRGITSTIFSRDIGLALKAPFPMRFFYHLFATDSQAMENYEQSDTIIQSNWQTFKQKPWQLSPYFLYLFHRSIHEWLPEITIDTLILHGDVDRVLIPERAIYLHKQLKNSRLQWIEGSGHLPFLERPALYERYITGWLQK